MRVLVCGGRTFADRERLYSELDTLNREIGITCVIEGGASGADDLAWHWASGRGTPTETFHADWKKHGKGAGHIRNQQMLDEGKPDLVVAFPGGRGTADMVRRAKKAGVRVIEVEP